MGKELVISSNRHETKVAVLEDDQLVEIYFQRANEYSLAGSIHKGRVTRVLPGMQSAFVDIGLERDAFLYVSDFFEENEEYDRIGSTGAEEKGGRNGKPTAAPEPKQSAPVSEPEAVKPESRPVAAATEPAEESDGGKDRRGRRSRRRRSRGRGFPESKYATDVTTETSKPEEEAEAPRQESELEEFPVLPGESLAKYRRAADEDAGEPQPEAEAAAGEAARAEAQAETPVELESAPDEESNGSEETVSSYEELYREDAETEPQSAAGAPDASADLSAGATAAIEEVNVPGLEVSAEEATQLVAEAALNVDADVESAGDGPVEPETEQAPPAEPADASEPFEAEPVEEEDVEGAPEASGEDESATATASESEAADQEESQEVEPARIPVSLTATLRERGERYMHRVSRRARRKMRTAGLSDSRVEERRHEASRPAVETEPEADVETKGRTERPQPSISDLLKEGQEILVQIAKEPLGQKGARITSHIALPGRYVVYMPTVEHLGVSRKIASDEERSRLRRILQQHRPGAGGFIIRTAGEGKSEDEIASDMRFLYALWSDLKHRAESRRAPALIHHDLDLVQRILRDQMTDTFKAVWCDNEETYESVLRFVQRFQPGAVGRVKMYTRPAPIFDAFNISNELEKALRPKVWLKSGGYIVINQTEALVAIDVNTGKFVGKSNRLEDTIVKTNLEAVKEIVRQIRLRDLGGIIVVDFIDMDERKNRQRVMQALEEAIRADRAPNKILQFNDFGLVAITRKRVKQSLERTLCSPCPHCEGSGYIKSVQTVIGEILQEAHKLAPVIEGKDAMLRVNPEVAKVLKSHENHYLEELEEVLRRPVIVTSDPLLLQEKFDLV